MAPAWYDDPHDGHESAFTSIQNLHHQPDVAAKFRTANQFRTNLFITNDGAFRRVTGLPVVVLDELR